MLSQASGLHRSKQGLVLPAVARLLFGIVLSGCGGGSQQEATNPKQEIIGTWSCGHVTVTFSSSGVKFSGTNSDGLDVNGSGGGPFTDATHIIVGWEMGLGLVKVHIRGSQMTLTADN